jgi:hypothetical protein
MGAQRSAETTEDVVFEVAPVTVTFDSIRWEVDFGGGITQRFADRAEAVAAARHAAASEGRGIYVDR